MVQFKDIRKDEIIDIIMRKVKPHSGGGGSNPRVIGKYSCKICKDYRISMMNKNELKTHLQKHTKKELWDFAGKKTTSELIDESVKRRKA